MPPRKEKRLHRTIEITTPPSYTDELVDELGKLDGVISLSVVRGASLKPEGDVLTVHALNRGADEVLRLAEAASEHGRVSVSTGELSSLVDPEHQQAVAEDVDEALWEEVETGLRHQSRTTANYLILMALGGAIAATGFVVHSTEQAISFMAAAIVAPGFDALAKTSVGLTLRRWGVATRGLGSAALGYLVLALSAALVLVVLRLTGVTTVGEFAHNHAVKSLAHPALRGVLLSACGALAGMVMLTSYRRYLLPGALIALLIIESAALVGASLAAGEPDLALGALGRFVISAALVVAAGMLVMGLKQILVHRRKPMVMGSRGRVRRLRGSGPNAPGS